MLFRKSVAVIVLIIIVCSNGLAQNKAYYFNCRKFTTGDDLSWSKPGAGDTSWKEQRLGEVWQRQGFTDTMGMPGIVFMSLFLHR